MSHPQTPSKGFLFFSFLYHEDFDFEVFKNDFFKKYGEGVTFSHPFFPMKDYYEKEMGGPLKRTFMVAHKKVPREFLVEAKLFSYEIEKQYMEKDCRKVNIDPGLITLENFQLATFKSFSHRIYLSKNVFSDLNLCFSKKSYKTLEWTYPDYKHPEIVEFIQWNRALLLRDGFN